MTTTMTPEAMDRSYEMSASLQAGTGLPSWMYSPPTPESPERIEPGPDGKPPVDRSVVVDCGGALYDRIVLYRLHEYTPPAIFDKAGPILSRLLHSQWGSWNREDRPSTDAKSENRDRREEILALAAKCAAAGTSPTIERRRAWRVIDWTVRTGAAAFLELGRWADYAESFRSLPPIMGPRLPRDASVLFRAAHLETDRASSAALKGRRPYRRDRAESGPGRVSRLVPSDLSHSLAFAVKDAFPEVYRRHIRWDVPRREETALGRAVQAGAYARICIDHDPRISDAEVKRVLASRAESARALLDEVIAMGSTRALA